MKRVANRTLGLLALLGMILPGAAAAAIVPMPDLTGMYEFEPDVPPDFGAPFLRSMDFMLPEGITSIDEVSVVVSGEWTAGEWTCGERDAQTEVMPMLPSLIVFITSSAFPDARFEAIVDLPDAPFTDLTAELIYSSSSGGEDFNLLIGNPLHVEIGLGAVAVGMCRVSLDTYGTLEDVALNITGVIPVESSPWASVKSLYR